MYACVNVYVQIQGMRERGMEDIVVKVPGPHQCNMGKYSYCDI